MRPTHALVTVFALLALAGCAAPPEADRPPSARVLQSAPPSLAPTETFRAPRETGAAEALRLSAQNDALKARADALRARGAALSGTAVVDPQARDRLTPRTD